LVIIFFNNKLAHILFAAAIVIPIVVSIIDLIGLVGNCLVVGAVIRYKAMRSAPNIFIGKLLKMFRQIILIVL